MNSIEQRLPRKSFCLLYTIHMQKDALYRVSFKCLIKNSDGKVLVVKERGRTSWDLPGGGIEHNETIEESIARELYEEVSFKGEFNYRVIKIHNPGKLATRDVWQMSIVLLLDVNNYDFSVGREADEVKFINPEELEASNDDSESGLLEYLEIVSIWELSS